MNLLEVIELKVGFKVPKDKVELLRGVSFTLKKGEILGLVGESGAGKTIMALAISGLLPHPLRITGGRIIFNGKDIDYHNPRAWKMLRGLKIFVLFQSPSLALNPVSRIGKQIQEVLTKVRKYDRPKSWRETYSLLYKVGLDSFWMDCYPFQLSGGMRQRILIAIALAMEPELLIADEPATGLDAVNKIEVLDLLHSMRDKSGTSIIIICHDIREISYMADRVAIMDEGCLLEELEIQEMLVSPSHPLTKEMARSLLDMDASTDEFYPVHR